MKGMMGMSEEGDERDDGDEKVIPIASALIKDVRDLVVFKKAYQVSLDIHKATLLFPKIEQYALADQLRRSSKAICANLAEGFGKQHYSKAEFGRFIAIAEASVTETQVWLQYAYDLGYIVDVQFLQWDKDYRIVKSMLYKLRSSL